MNDTRARLAESLAGRYEIERELGAGGMATVYLARDLRHRRRVALKVMRPELGGGLAVDRFLREIELAAGLQHPHIVPVFDSGAERADATHPTSGAELLWYTMPLIEGESVRRRLQREGSLTIGDALTIAEEAADALGYAHARGIIHRDVKPENILLSGGHAMVADFGVAKAVAAEPGSPALTGVGIVVGTPHYMSPEQASGGDAVDARSDQYSLGCVLYEMLTGEPPFTGTSGQSVMAQSLAATRPKASRVRPDAAAELDALIQRAMAIDPNERFPDMAGFSAALRAARGAPAGHRAGRRAIVLGAVVAAAAAGAGAWFATHLAGHSVAPEAESIAVLPFNTSGPGVEFLGEGMVDLLSTNLSGVGGIRAVDPRTVLRKAGDRAAGTGDGLEHALSIGRELGAGSVVLGSAVGAGERVRLAADFYSVGGERLGRAQVDGPADSVLPLVDRLSLALLRDVWRSREPIPALSLASQTTDSLEALRAYLRGEQYYRRLAFDSAEQAYNRAVEVDSTFALAHFRRALTYGWTGGYGSPASRRASAAAAQFSSKLPPRERRLLGGYSLFDRGKPSSVDSFRLFVREYPDDVDGWYLLGEALYHTREYTGAAPDTISAAFDSVVRRDSGLVPALIHPVELALLMRDSTRFRRYLPFFARSAPARAAMLRTLAGTAWGPLPPDSAIRSLSGQSVGHLFSTLHSVYQDDATTSDSVLGRFMWALRLIPAPTREVRAQALGEIGRIYAGLGQLGKTRALADTVLPLDRGQAAGLLGTPMALGLAPADYGRGVLDSIVSTMPAEPFRDYIEAFLPALHGRPEEARRRVDALLSRLAPEVEDMVRGQAVAAQGYLMMLEGDSSAGLARLAEGIELAASPGFAEQLGFFRFQLALALASRPATRREGIERLRNSFQLEPQLLPLAFLALGRAWEQQGEPDSAATYYGRFLRLWDQADPALQDRVEQARDALQRLTAEPR